VGTNPHKGQHASVPVLWHNQNSIARDKEHMKLMQKMTKRLS